MSSVFFDFFANFFQVDARKLLTKNKNKYIISFVNGDMAQLVERLVRNEEASGSNPLISTKKDLKRTTLWRLGFSFFTHEYKIVLRAFLWAKETLFIMS